MNIVFREPDYLWLLVISALLVAASVWRFLRRRRDVRQLAARRIVPARQRLGIAGDLHSGFSLSSPPRR